MAGTRVATTPTNQTPVRRSLTELCQPGPHPVLRGDLGLVDLPGVVFTPAAGSGLPAVSFGHGWLQPTTRYAGLLRHLASWGIVAAAPAGEGGPFPSYPRFAADLTSTLDLCWGVRLGSGQISVDPGRLAVAGHGAGGGAAVLAAAADPRIAAVVTLAVAETRPSAIEAAGLVRAPGLHLAAGKDRAAPPAGNAELVAARWGGPTWLRVLPKARHLGFAEGRHWTDLIVDGSAEPGTGALTRGLVTAFLLRQLTGDTGQDELIDGPVRGTVVRAFAAS